MKKNNLRKILIANRAEIAARIARAVSESGKTLVAIYSEYDRDLPFVSLADEAYSLGSGSLADTYLNQDKIIEIALRAGVDAIHPGYGFLSENASFAAKCKESNLVFIGPEPEVIDRMGNKVNAREAAIASGVPVLKGNTGSLKELLSEAENYTYPLLVKPAAGGGGKGMRIAEKPEELRDALEDAEREATNYFSSGELYLETYVRSPRHIEVQVIADHHGNAAHLFERECSLQRRYQKVIEEAPSPSLDEKTRSAITESALKLVKGIGYTNAGTVEFLMDNKKNFYFLEMNTRIQVEHPVSEVITGIDIVSEQLRIAEGQRLSFRQEDLTILGHAIEARVYAEDTENNFMPSPGRIRTMEEPVNKWTRIDSGFQNHTHIRPFYDPMISKVITSGSNRQEALNHMVTTLKHYHITGIKTNRDFLLNLVQHKDFKENRIHTRYLDEKASALNTSLRTIKSKTDHVTLVALAAIMALEHDYQNGSGSANLWQTIGHWRMLPGLFIQFDGTDYRVGYEILERRKRYTVCIEEKCIKLSLEQKRGNSFWIKVDEKLIHCWGEVDGADIHVDVEGFAYHARRLDILDDRYVRKSHGKEGAEDNNVLAPLNGKIVELKVNTSDSVKKGDTLMIIESMKMENRILAPRDAVIDELLVHPGDLVESNNVLLTLK
jgi:acetyl/propionyl-CoA carboxylase alpha subunit